jgi:hypothetical protein
MINSFAPLLYAVVVIAVIIAMVKLIFTKSGWKDCLITLGFGAVLSTFAKVPNTLYEIGNVIVKLIKDVGGNINV